LAKVAFLFPGQGAQYPGMGRALAEAFPVAGHILEQASEAVGWDLRSLCFEGPEAELVKTEYAQPAILAVSLAAAAVVREAGIEPEGAAGLSLGEYGALTVAGAMPFPEVIRIVHLRGRFMQEAVPLGVGAMAAVIGLDREVVEAICLQVKDHEVVQPANYNCPGQIVIAGHTQAVERAMRLCQEAGARRVTRLAVSAPFHTPLLAPASARLAEVLGRITIGNLRIPVASNVTGDVIDDPRTIADLLVRQVASPVRFEDNVRALGRLGFDTFVEVGPGKSLSGFVRRILPGARTFNVEDTASLEATLESWRGVC